MESTNYLQCPSCKEWFRNQRALSQHFLQTCQHTTNTKNQNQAKVSSYSKRSLSNDKLSPKRPRLNENFDIGDNSPGGMLHSNNHISKSNRSDIKHPSTVNIDTNNNDLILQQSDSEQFQVTS